MPTAGGEPCQGLDFLSGGVIRSEALRLRQVPLLQLPVPGKSGRAPSLMHKVPTRDSITASWLRDATLICFVRPAIHSI